MAAPKRKSPDRRKTSKPAPSRFALLTAAVLSAAGRHRRVLLGSACFVVVFSFVAANALWYQPRRHPAPLLATRMLEKPTRTAKADPAPREVAAIENTDPGVTTFRIEREMEPDVVEHVEPIVPPAKAVVSPLIRAIQQELAGRGLYDGAADGLIGPKTTSAILFFEETEGLAPTGEASQVLLDRLRAATSVASRDAVERPSDDMTASTRKTDDVAALISKVSSTPVAVIPAKRPVSPELVMKIQQALSDMAYRGVKVDGIVGEATRSAIRAFEKSYRMKVTGEPSETLLKKLKSIGAV